MLQAVVRELDGDLGLLNVTLHHINMDDDLEVDDLEDNDLEIVHRIVTDAWPEASHIPTTIDPGFPYHGRRGME